MAYTLATGDTAPHFDLLGVDGVRYSTSDFTSPTLVVTFMCNHCPFVIGSIDRIKALALRFAPHGVAFVGINSNEGEVRVADSFAQMVEFARQHELPFPYLHDEEQSTVVHYGALRTPHFYVFDRDRRLVYTGRLDDSPRHPGRETTSELADVLQALVDGRPAPVAKTNPIGCTIKWKGRDPHWMPPEACDLV